MSRYNRSSNKTTNPSWVKSTRIIPWQRSTLQYNCNCSCIPNNFLSRYTSIYWGIWKLIITINTWCSRYSIPTSKQHKILATTTIINTSTILCCRRKGGWNRMNCLPTTIIKFSTCWSICRPSNFFSSFSRRFINLRSC